MINNDTKIVNQIKAVMISHAIGDALGVPVELCTREELKQKPVTKLQSPKKVFSRSFGCGCFS